MQTFQNINFEKFSRQDAKARKENTTIVYHGEKSFFYSMILRVLCGYIFLLFIVSFMGCQKEKVPEGGGSGGLVIWTYDSFNSEWGPGPDVSVAFEAKTGIKITWESRGDAGLVLSRLLQEKENAGADLILGLDQNMAERILESGLLETYRPAGAEGVFPELILDPAFHLSPLPAWKS